MAFMSGRTHRDLSLYAALSKKRVRLLSTKRPEEINKACDDGTLGWIAAFNGLTATTWLDLAELN